MAASGKKIVEKLRRKKTDTKITMKDLGKLKDNRGLMIPDPQTDPPQSKQKENY